MTISDLGGAQGTGWDRTFANKWALEWLLATGELACVRRQGWQRVYQHASTVVPESLLSLQPTDDECIRSLSQIALSALGIATADDIADHFRLPVRRVTALLPTLDNIEPAKVEGWPDAWADASALQPGPVDPQACTPLSPFDSLLWHRPRMRRLFGVEYLLEAYKPKAKRECGYFGMPVLAGTQIIGRIAVRVSKGRPPLKDTNSCRATILPF
ncbi:DNA glycosylase AlkZ-like family protein [Streptomyces sp. NPDC051217]|uniref:DNA glycosylase AlkZ-like family protein n=1 Tax=Streptomyces sp. NPDC051217 TaxID=3365644 RepID=UPI00378B8E67